MIQITKQGNKIISLYGSAKVKDIKRYGMIQASLQNGLKTVKIKGCIEDGTE